jgi:Fe-S cluster assembly ATPase SufC
MNEVYEVFYSASSKKAVIQELDVLEEVFDLLKKVSSKLDDDALKKLERKINENCDKQDCSLMIDWLYDTVSLHQSCGEWIDTINQQLSDDEPREGPEVYP